MRELLGISLLMLGAPAIAEPLRVEPRIAPACVAAARELGPRLDAIIDRASANGLQASVAIEAIAARYRVTVALRDADRDRGTTTIDAPTCEEAVDAATVVLALALGETKRLEETEPAAAVPLPERTVSERPPIAPIQLLPAPTGERASSDRMPAHSSVRATRLTLATGVDRGTLPHPTLTLAGAVTRSFGGLELAAVARYGLPVAEERVESGISESQRHDFGGLELRACRGVGQAVRVSACAGTEVGAVRARHALQADDGAEVDTDDISPRLSGTLATLVAHRGGLIEPGVELAGAAVAVGRQAGAPWLSVRVAAGAAIAF